MSADPSRPSLLGNCREPKHQELFLAVVDATKIRSGTRHRQAERGEELQALYKRNLPTLEGRLGGS